MTETANSFAFLTLKLTTRESIAIPTADMAQGVVSYIRVYLKRNHVNLTLVLWVRLKKGFQMDGIGPNVTKLYVVVKSFLNL
jgi:hypothetical protein